jgi:hypothetical protein
MMATVSRRRGSNSKYHRLIGVPDVKREEEEIDVVYSDKENYELKRLQMCIEFVPTCRVLYIKIWYTFRILGTWHCVGSLVQHRNSVYDAAYPLMSLNLIESAICL